MIYICKNWPTKKELTLEKLAGVIFLVDWKHVLEYGEQMTDIQWEISNFGPSVESIYSLAKNKNECFKLSEVKNNLGFRKFIIRVRYYAKENLSREEVDITDFIIEKYTRLSEMDFIRLIKSTYPVYCQQSYQKLDLVNLAKEYQYQKA